MEKYTDLQGKRKTKKKRKKEKKRESQKGYYETNMTREDKIALCKQLYS